MDFRSPNLIKRFLQIHGLTVELVSKKSTLIFSTIKSHLYHGDMVISVEGPLAKVLRVKFLKYTKYVYQEIHARDYTF